MRCAPILLLLLLAGCEQLEGLPLVDELLNSSHDFIDDVSNGTRAVQRHYNITPLTDEQARTIAEQAWVDAFLDVQTLRHNVGIRHDFDRQEVAQSANATLVWVRPGSRCFDMSTALDVTWHGPSTFTQIPQSVLVSDAGDASANLGKGCTNR